jgi:hypothetical protein
MHHRRVDRPRRVVSSGVDDLEHAREQRRLRARGDAFAGETFVGTFTSLLRGTLRAVTIAPSYTGSP